MTQILYIVGDGSKNSDWELRWSLRSVDKYALDDVEPIVVGRVPDWFKGKGVPCGDPFDRKEQNINHKIITAIEAGAVEGDFQLSADDHFWTMPVEFADLPICYREGLLPEESDYICGVSIHGEPMNNYARALIGTRELLQGNGLAGLNTACHINTWANAGDVGAAKELIRKATGRAKKYGVVAWALWPNLRMSCASAARGPGRRLAMRRDKKYRGEKEFDRFIAELMEFSINDKAFGNEGFINYMIKNYSGKSRWER